MSAPRGAIVTSDQELFAKGLATYQKVVAANYMAHEQVYTVLHEVLLRQAKDGFVFADLACGAAPFSAVALAGAGVARYMVTTDVATGERRDALGENVRGFAVYTPERVTFLILKNNRKPPQRSPPSGEEKIALYDTMFAYSGSYTVESDRVIHHVDMSWNEAWSGTEQVRYGALDDNTLTYTTAPAKNPFDGREVTHMATFEREKRPLN